MSDQRKQTWRMRLKRLAPFGLGQRDKPKHYRVALEALGENRDNLRYAWKVLSRGVCESCALGVSGFYDWTIGEPHLCLKRLDDLRKHTVEPINHKFLAGVSDVSLMTDEELRKLGRLGHPMRRRYAEPGFTRISWEDAQQRIADHIRERKGERIGFHLSAAGLSNETYYVAQKVARFFGTNNIDTGGGLTHNAARASMNHALGVGDATCSYADMWGSDLVVFFGGRPARDQPVMTNYIYGARRSGARLVSVTPELDPDMEYYWVPSITSSAAFGSRMTDDWFAIGNGQGSMAAFLYGTLRVMVEQGWCDEAFIDTFTVGFDTLRQRVEATDWPTLERLAGAERASMADFAERLHKAQKAVFVWPVGAAAHAPDAVATQMIVSLALSKGFVGRRSCGLIPIPMDASLSGAVAMGACPGAFPGNRPVNTEMARQISGHWGFAVPDEPGHSAHQMLEAAQRDRLSMLYCIGGNVALPGVGRHGVERAMERVRLRVHQDAILTEQMFIEPKREDGEVLLLPAKSLYEQRDGGTLTSAERRVMFSPEMPREVGETLTHWRTLLQLAHRVEPKRAMRLGCDSGEEIRAEIARVIAEYHGIQYLEKAGDAFQCGGRRLCEDWQFPTADGKAHFLAPPLPEPAGAPATGRSVEGAVARSSEG